MGGRSSFSKGEPVPNTREDEQRIDAIRFLSVDAVQKANSGHPGMPLGAAATAYTIWTKHLRFNPKDPAWFNRDRFILSAGHASMLLYSLLVTMFRSTISNRSGSSAARRRGTLKRIIRPASR